MKLKGLGNRAYNILFHTHTVGGLVISVALYIIFFAGAFTLFRPEFYAWENPEARRAGGKPVDVMQVFDVVQRQIEGADLDEGIIVVFPTEKDPHIQVYGHVMKDGREEHFASKVNSSTLTVYEEPPSTVGDTLYRLHYLDQLPYAGRWIAGFVSLFFVMVVINGVLIHWKNLLAKFWSFSFKGTWKQIWTNSHTVFGLLGLPYQLMYAVTGAFYLLLILVLLPAVMVYYGGDPEKVYGLAYPNYSVTVDHEAPTADHIGNIRYIDARVKEQYGADFDILGVQASNVYKADGVISYRLRSKDSSVFSSEGYVGYRLADQSEVYASVPGVNKKNTHKIIETINHLHFATFGGILVKALYFLMALFTCFVIISGILIWKEARKNAKYTDRQRRFHHRITVIFLAVCFGLFPATALLFHAELLVKGGEAHSLSVNAWFFVFWLVVSVVGVFLNAEKRITRFNLGLGGLLSLAVPLTNGMQTGDWFWQAFGSGMPYVAGTDLFWCLTGLLCLALFFYYPGRFPTPRQSTVRQKSTISRPVPPVSARGSSRGVASR